MSEVKSYSWDELKAAEAADKKGILMLIHGKVYAISKFLDEVRLQRAPLGGCPRELTLRASASTLEETRFCSVRPDGMLQRLSRM